MGVSVVVETGSRRVFASALDWPGWSRAGRDEQSATEALLEHGRRWPTWPRARRRSCARAHGGGRDRDAVVQHVVEAENAYAGKIGLRPSQVADLREAILAVLSTASDGRELRPGGWTSRYAARRIAWHVLDHAWEIEDKSERS